MTKDDFHVVLYKVLSYLYECLKAGVRPRLEVAQAEVKIEPVYWNSVIQMALDGGYIAGVHLTQYIAEGDGALVPQALRIRC